MLGDYEFRLAAPGMSQAVIARPGSYDGNPIVIRPGRSTYTTSGTTAAGLAIQRAVPDLYEYTLRVPFGTLEYELMDQLLDIQESSGPGVVQFLDLLHPISASRIKGYRTSYGTPGVSGAGLAVTNFQGKCVVENQTENDALPIGCFEDNGDRVFLSTYLVREI